MRAAGVTTYGGPFESFDVADPDPSTLADGQVIVRVAAAGMGLWDDAIGAGALGTEPPAPRVLGSEGSGVIDAVGPGVEGLTVGDRVLGYDHAGAWYAERTVALAGALARIPDQLDLETAAALPIGGVTAVQGLLEDVWLQAGETIIVGGAAGGTGALVVQFAHHIGARVVATAGPANLEYARSSGADLVLDHTHGVEATVDAVRAFAPGGADVLFDGVSPENVVALSNAVKDGGRVATLTWPLPDLRPSLQGFQIVSAATPERLAEVVRLATAGVLQPVVRHVFGLGDVAKAHEILSTRHGRGKILLAPNGDLR
jgi:NADPH:quinone reductase-like Zn-dependent oxidoreductase